MGDVIPSRTHRNTYAFIYDLAFIEGGRWELAPAYDLTGTPASCEDDVWGNFANVHAMSINGKQQGITDDDMIKVGDRFGIGNAQAITAELRDILKRKP